MTVRTPTGETFVGRVEADEHGVLWLIDAEGVRYQLAVVFQGGWGIVDATPAERARLEAHGFGSGRIQ
jgi:hypothetical protein